RRPPLAGMCELRPVRQLRAARRDVQVAREEPRLTNGSRGTSPETRPQGPCPGDSPQDMSRPTASPKAVSRGQSPRHACWSHVQRPVPGANLDVATVREEFRTPTANVARMGRRTEWHVLALVTLALTAFGIVMVYSATSASAVVGGANPMSYLER